LKHPLKIIFLRTDYNETSALKKVNKLKYRQNYIKRSEETEVFRHGNNYYNNDEHYLSYNERYICSQFVFSNGFISLQSTSLSQK